MNRLTQGVTNPPSKRRKHRRQREGRQSPLNQMLKYSWTLRPAGAVLFFALTLIALGSAVLSNSDIAHGQGIGPDAPPAGVISKAQAIAKAKCGVAGKPACMPNRDTWVALRSTTSGDILAAVKSTPMFQSAQRTPDPIGAALQTGSLGMPVFVQPYRSDVNMAPLWIIPVLNAKGTPTAFLEYAYDASHARIMPWEFDAVSGNMFYNGRIFPYMPSAEAASAVLQQHHVHTRSGMAPRLVYFPMDVEGNINGTAPWSAGGTAAIDPIWAIPGDDGHWHYVDHNGAAHFAHEIPVAPGVPGLLDQ